jgi:hypothetical protein
LDICRILARKLLEQVIRAGLSDQGSALIIEAHGGKPNIIQLAVLEPDTTLIVVKWCLPQVLWESVTFVINAKPDGRSPWLARPTLPFVVTY